MHLKFYLNYVEKRYLRCAYRSYELPIMKDTEEPIKIDSFNKRVENWRYFYNKSMFDFINKRYVDSIIAAAISVESYSWELLQKHFNNVEEAVIAYASK